MKFKSKFILLFVFFMCLPFCNLIGQHFKLQLGLELGKYVRNWDFVKQPPVEVVALAFHDGNAKIYPRISIGYGNFLMKKNNYEAQISGYYVKPGLDFYIGKKNSIFKGVLSGNLILGNYKYNNTVFINNPVWGDYVVKENGFHGSLSGIEFNYGFLLELNPKIELKIIWGLRGVLSPSSFSENAKGIIPGFGTSYGNYSASPSGTIILSYRIN